MKRTLKISRPAIFGAVVLVVCLEAWLNYSGGMPYGDASTYAVVARSISEGVGIYQNSFTPLGLSVLGKYPTADFAQSPGLPLIESIFFRIFGAQDFVVAIVSALFSILLIYFAYLLAEKFFADKKKAYLTLALLLFNPFVSLYTASGLTEPVCTAFFMGALIVHFYFEKKFWSYFLFGALISCSLLVRSTIIFYAPAIFILLWSGAWSRRLNRFALFCFGFFIVQLPFMLRSYLHPELNDVYMSLVQTVTLDLDHTAFIRLIRSLNSESLHIPTFVLLKSHAWEFWTRTEMNAAKLAVQLFLRGRGLNVLFLLFLATPFLLGTRDKKSYRMIVFTWILFIFSFAGFAIAWPIDRYFFPILPLIAIVAVRNLFNLIEKLPKNPPRIRKAWFFVLILVVIGPFVLTTGRQILLRIEHQEQPYKWAYLKKFIEESVPANTTVVTNFPDLVSWYGGAQRRALLYPNTTQDLQTIDQKYERIDAILLTDELSWLFPGGAEWKEFLDQKESPAGFKLQKRFEDSQNQAVVYLKER